MREERKFYFLDPVREGKNVNDVADAVLKNLLRLVVLAKSLRNTNTKQAISMLLYSVHQQRPPDHR